MKKSQMIIFDIVLRDGSQAESISFSVDDKLNIIQKLDDFGIHYLKKDNCPILKSGSSIKKMEQEQKSALKTLFHKVR